MDRTERRSLAAIPATVLKACARAIAAGLEMPVSRRGLTMGFFGLASLWICSAWLRPPLTADFTALDLPIGYLLGGGPEPIALFQGSRSWRWDSLGVLALGFLAVAAVALFWRPRWLATVAGLLLVLAIVANAALAWNHPLMTESLVSETVQRDRMVALLWAIQEDSMSNRQNGRVQYGGIARQDPDGLLGSWDFLEYGVWLGALAAVGVLCSGGGSLVRRFARLGAWAAGGLVAASVLCSPRLLAEWWWYRAELSQSEADFAASRQWMEKAVHLYPELGRLQRAWLLRGQLDYFEQIASPQRDFWTATQLSYQQDPLSLRQDPMALHNPNLTVKKYLALVNVTMRKLIAQCPDEPVVRQQTADLLVITALQFYYGQKLGAAADALHEALRAQPERLDAVFYLGVVQSQMDWEHPELVDRIVTPVLERCADEQLRADLLAFLGTTFFQGGQVSMARQRYSESYELLNLPMRINLPAQRGLGGM